jgi:hypothetical protein
MGTEALAAGSGTGDARCQIEISTVRHAVNVTDRKTFAAGDVIETSII